MDNLFLLQNLNLKAEVNRLRGRIVKLESGEAYQALEQVKDSLISENERREKYLRHRIAEEHAAVHRAWNHWYRAMEDCEREYQRRDKAREAEIEMVWRAYNTKDIENNQLREQVKELKSLLAERDKTIEDQNALIGHLKVKKDFTNSSVPSSGMETHAKIPNSREKTGRKPGGQPGHKGHPRKKLAPTKPPVVLQPEAEILDDPDFKKTSRVITKYKYVLHTYVEVLQYDAPVYYNAKTGERVHGAFPNGVVNEVNYDGTIKAFLYLLTTKYRVSIDDARDFLAVLTDDQLHVSKGTVSNLLKQFSQKTQASRDEIFKELSVSPVMHLDATNARVNGKNTQVFITATDDGLAEYDAREHKGHEGVKGTPAEHYLGVIIHDHDRTFYSYGGAHQECLAHVLRYLKGVMEQEPDLPWAKEMHDLVQSMIHYRNQQPDHVCDTDDVTRFEMEYDRILQTAEVEYTEHPPSKYFPDGCNLAQRMKEYKSAHLLFLHNPKVDSNNNLAERRLRSFKRKQKQAVTFRSFEYVQYVCDGLTVLISLCLHGKQNVYREVATIFN